MSCIVTPMPPAPHAPCMRALAPSYDSVNQASDPRGPWMLQTHQQRMHMKALKSTSRKFIAADSL